MLTASLTIQSLMSRAACHMHISYMLYSRLSMIPRGLPHESCGNLYHRYKCTLTPSMCSSIFPNEMTLRKRYYRRGLCAYTGTTMSPMSKPCSCLDFLMVQTSNDCGLWGLADLSQKRQQQAIRHSGVNLVGRRRGRALTAPSDRLVVHVGRPLFVSVETFLEGNVWRIRFE